MHEVSNMGPQAGQEALQDTCQRMHQVAITGVHKVNGLTGVIVTWDKLRLQCRRQHLQCLPTWELSKINVECVLVFHVTPPHKKPLSDGKWDHFPVMEHVVSRWTENTTAGSCSNPAMR